MSDVDCGQVIATTAEDLAEIDLDARDALLEHLADCDRCRTHVAARTCD